MSNSNKSGLRRTTHRSVSGRKLYALRDDLGRIHDVQTYERAHRTDLRFRSEAERRRRSK
jgi:hypothetical protein